MAEPALGVGVVLNSAVPAFVRAVPGALDYAAVTPETFWADARLGAGPERFRESALMVAGLDEVARSVPLVGHGVALSIGTAGRLDVEHLEQVARWCDRYGFAWYGEHLSYTRVESERIPERHAGLALPIPYDRDVLDEVCGRVAAVCERLPVPLVLENGVAYTSLPDEELTEPAFLDELCERTGTWVLLDLHNLYTNVVNGLVDADRYLDELDLTRVLEIHVAGGRELAGMWSDAHSGPCPDGVWDMLDQVLPSCPNVRGVAFEFVAGHYETLGPDGVAAQLDRARAAWGAVRA